MAFNTPITVQGDVSTDGITRPDGYGSVKLESVLDLTQIMVKLNEDDDMPEKRCSACGDELSDDEPTQNPDGDTECSARDEDDAPHTPEFSPLAWAKNITVSFVEERDEIELAIATGDPRGGWTFRLRRDPKTGVVYMHLPHADMDGPHEPIRELHPGTFVIG